MPRQPTIFRYTIVMADTADFENEAEVTVRHRFFAIAKDYVLIDAAGDEIGYVKVPALQLFAKRFSIYIGDVLISSVKVVREKGNMSVSTILDAEGRELGRSETSVPAPSRIILPKSGHAVSTVYVKGKECFEILCEFAFAATPRGGQVRAPLSFRLQLPSRKEIARVKVVGGKLTYPSYKITLLQRLDMRVLLAAFLQTIMNLQCI